MEVTREQLLEIIEKQAQQIKRLEALVKKLQANSTNSSRPPSSDSPAVRAKRRKLKKKKPSTRAQGAQKGHEPHKRALLQTDVVEHVRPSHCSDCKHVLIGDDSNPKHHQFVELPPISAHVTDFLLHTLQCSCCGKSTSAQTPAHVGANTYGPGIAAMACALTGSFGMSRRQARDYLNQALGVCLSLGTVHNLEKRGASALHQAWLDAREHIRGSEVVHVDETSWSQTRGEKGWAWSASTPDVSLYALHPNRSKEGFFKLMSKEYEGIVVSDRFSVYLHNHKGPSQWCWAHLLRQFDSTTQSSKGLIQSCAKRLAQLGRLISKIWRWDRNPGPTIPHLPGFAQELHPKLRQDFEDTLTLLSQLKGAPGWSRALLKQQDGLWTFEAREDVGMTNNLAERRIRPLVLARKG
jgi:transposase